MTPRPIFPSNLVILVLSMLAGCSNNSTPVSPDNTGPIMPLAVGNQWIGRTSYLDSSGATLRTEFDTLQIISEIAINSERWYITNREFMQFMTNRADGLWTRPFGGTSPHAWEMFRAKHPASVGDVFGTDALPVTHLWIDSLPPNRSSDSLMISWRKVSATGRKYVQTRWELMSVILK